MKTKNIIKALEKEGYQVKNRTENDYKERCNYFYCNNGFYKCDWYGEEETSYVSVMRSSDKNEIERDYFPGFFCRTIKDLIQSMKRK